MINATKVFDLRFNFHYNEIYKYPLDDVKFYKLSHKGGMMTVKELLTEDRIEMGVRADSWQEAVRAAGKLLVETGVVEESYVKSMVKTTEDLGPYIVIAPGLAIPHGRPEDGVLEPCLSFVSLESPVEFGHADNDPVKVLIALGARNHDDHVDALSQIANILSVESNLSALMAATTKDEVKNILWQE